MFKNSFQGGPALEVFSPQGSASTVMNWKVTTKSAVQRQYDKDIKGYCYSLAKNGKLQLPKEERQTAYLLHPYLVLQAYLPMGANMCIELCMTDLNNNKRRFIISSFNKEYKNTALHVMLPFTAVKRGVWLNLCLDLVSLISDCFKGQSFRSLDTIILSGVFRLRKIFSMKCQPPDTTGEYDFSNSISGGNSEAIQRSLQFPFGVEYLTQVLNIPRLAGFEALAETPSVIPSARRVDSKLPSVTSSASSGNSSIAFGRRIDHAPFLPGIITTSSASIGFGSNNNFSRVPTAISKQSPIKPIKQQPQQRTSSSKANSRSGSRLSIKPVPSPTVQQQISNNNRAKLAPIPIHQQLDKEISEQEEHVEEENEHSHEEETVLHTNQPALPNLEYDPSKYQDDYNEETDFPVNDSSIVIRSQQVHSRHGSSDSVKSTTTTTQLQQHHHRRLKIGNHDDDEDGDSLAKLQSEIDQYMKSQQHMDSEHEADAAVMLLEQSAPAAEGQSGPARSADHHHILNSNATGNIHRSNVTNSRLVDASTTASNIYDGGFGEEEESLTTNHQRPPLAAASSPHYAAHDEKDNGDEFIAHHQSIIDNNSKKASNHSNDSLVSRGTTSAWHDDLNTLSRNMSEMSLPPPLPDELSASHHNLPIVGGGVAGSSRPSSRPSSRLYAIDAKRGVSREGIHLSQKSSSSPGVSTTQPATTTASTKLSTFANRPSTSSSSKGWGGIDSTETTAMKIRGASAEDSKVVQECIHSLSIQMHHDQLVTAAVSSVVKKPASARSIIETRQVVSEIRALQAVAEKIEARSLYAYDVPPVINNSAVAVAPAAEPSRPSSAEIRLKSSSSSRSRKKSSASSGGGSRSASRQSKAHPMLPTIDEIAHTPTDTVAIPGSLAKDDDGGEEVGLWANNGSSSYERVRRDFVSESLPQSRHGRLETSFNTEDVHHGAVIIHQRSSSMPSADDDDLIEKILQRSLESIKQLQLESVREMEASAAAAAQAAEVFNEVIESTSSAIHLQQQELLEQGEVEVVREDAEEEDKKEEGGDGKPNMVIAHHEAEPPISESHRNLVGDVDKKVENEDNDGEEPFNVVLEGSFAPPSPLHLNQNNMEEESSGEEEAEEEEEAISTSAAINNPSSNSTTSSAPPKSSSPSSNPKTPSSLKDRTKELVIEVSDEEDAGDDTLELLYDPETDLYYDPLTNKHYKLDDDNDEED